MRFQRALGKRLRCRCGCSELGAVVLQGSVHNGDSGARGDTRFQANIRWH